MERTAYEILGVSEFATDDEIKKQYHTLMRNVHSDATFLKDLTDKKRQRFLQEQQQKEDKINAKYHILREQYESKRVKIEMDLSVYQKVEKTTVENNHKVQEIKGKLEAVQGKLDTIAVKLGYQTQTSSYTSEYGMKM